LCLSMCVCLLCVCVTECILIHSEKRVHYFLLSSRIVAKININIVWWVIYISRTVAEDS
jgi:hypothetical protein